MVNLPCILTTTSLMTLWSRGFRFEASYLRTSGGLEVELLLEWQTGLLGFELKARSRVDGKDATALERAKRVLATATWAASWSTGETGSCA